jgi:hypothetical protein
MDLVTTDDDDLTLHVSLLKDLHAFMRQAKGSNLLFNLQAAAFGLSFMLKGYTVNDKLVSFCPPSNTPVLNPHQAVPNIPDSPDTVYNK